jgi:hypothetical protein
MPSYLLEKTFFPARGSADRVLLFEISRCFGDFSTISLTGGTRRLADRPNLGFDGDTVIVYFDAAATAKDGQPYETLTPGTSDCTMAKSSKPRRSSTPSSSPTSGTESV